MMGVLFYLHSTHNRFVLLVEQGFVLVKAG